MRIIVFFDLPVKTKQERRKATQFRNFLIKDGFYMIQFSVYARVCNGNDMVELHKQRLRSNVPDEGSIRTLVITEKQYDNVEILLWKNNPIWEFMLILKQKNKNKSQQMLEFAGFYWNQLYHIKI